jgi:hypothetical protein
MALNDRGEELMFYIRDLLQDIDEGLFLTRLESSTQKKNGHILAQRRTAVQSFITKNELQLSGFIPFYFVHIPVCH